LKINKLNLVKLCPLSIDGLMEKEIAGVCTWWVVSKHKVCEYAVRWKGSVLHISQEMMCLVAGRYNCILWSEFEWRMCSPYLREEKCCHNSLAWALRLCWNVTELGEFLCFLSFFLGEMGEEDMCLLVCYSLSYCFLTSLVFLCLLLIASSFWETFVVVR
jgi:hypothetical protein